ncbi:MAG TPA: ABC transporter ATP-binding protein [Patescibacteria group bacterium]
MKVIFKDKISEIREVIHVSKRLLSFLWEKDKLTFSGMLVAVLIPAVLPFVNAYIYKLIIDLVVAATQGQFNYQQFYSLLGFRFLTMLVQYAAFSIQGYMDVVVWTKIPVYLYQLVLSKLATLDVEYFENSKFKDVLQRVRESYAWRPLNLYSSLFYMFQSMLQLLIAFVAIATLNWALAIGIVLAAIPAFINQLYYSKTLWGVWSEHSPHRKKFWYLSNLIQDREGVKELKIFQTAKKFLGEIDSMQSKFSRENLKVGKKRLRNSLILNVFATFIYLGIETFVVLITVSGRITLGSLSYFTFVVWNFENGVQGFFSNISSVFNHSQYVKDIIKVLDFEQKIVSKENSIRIDQNKTPKIEFKHVTFAYPQSKKKVLDDFSLVIKPGEKVAFVGENGAGKTTIIKLLARFYDVSGGEILINGNNLKDLDLESWYKSLGIIFQDFIKYEYTLSQNIHFGKIYAKFDLGKIEQAASLAGVDRLALDLDKGYDQMLGMTFEGGQELSLGQWQKVALARAFLRDAPVLILDEPTASIDAKSEKEIFDKVEKLSLNKSVIIISHRFSTVKNADRIYVIEKGKVKEQGSHDKLLKLNGTYAKLFKIQAERYR